MPTPICQSIPAVILSAHDTSAERDGAWVGAVFKLAPRYCLRCGVHLPEAKPLSCNEAALLIDATWWRWLAHQAPNGVDGLRETLYQAARDGNNCPEFRGRKDRL